MSSMLEFDHTLPTYTKMNGVDKNQASAANTARVLQQALIGQFPAMQCDFGIKHPLSLLVEQVTTSLFLNFTKTEAKLSR